MHVTKSKEELKCALGKNISVADNGKVQIWESSLARPEAGVEFCFCNLSLSLPLSVLTTSFHFLLGFSLW